MESKIQQLVQQASQTDPRDPFLDVLSSKEFPVHEKQKIATMPLQQAREYTSKWLAHYLGRHGKIPETENVRTRKRKTFSTPPLFLEKKKVSRPTLPEIVEKWSAFLSAPEDMKLRFLACLTLPEIVGVARLNKEFLKFVQDHLQEVASDKYPLEEGKAAICALAYDGGDTCPLAPADWQQRGRLLGQTLRDFCPDWCSNTATHLFWQTVMQWIYDNVEVSAIEYEGKRYRAAAYREDTPHAVEVRPRVFPEHPQWVRFILTAPYPFRIRDVVDTERPISIDMYNSLCNKARMAGSEWSRLQIFPKHLRQLTLISQSVGDWKRRDGKNNIEVEIPLQSTWTVYALCDQPLTLGQVAEAAFRVKFHTFENWFERFQRVSDKKKNNPTSLTLTINFDYGL